MLVKSRGFFRPEPPLYNAIVKPELSWPNCDYNNLLRLPKKPHTSTGTSWFLSLFFLCVSLKYIFTAKGKHNCDLWNKHLTAWRVMPRNVRLWVFLNYTFIGNHGAQCAHVRVLITLYVIKLFCVCCGSQSVHNHTYLANQFGLNLLRKWCHLVGACKNICNAAKD